MLMMFDDIGKGDEIELSASREGVTQLRRAVAHRFIAGALRRHDRWLTREGGIAVVRYQIDGAVQLRVRSHSQPNVVINIDERRLHTKEKQ